MVVNWELSINRLYSASWTGVLRGLMHQYFQSNPKTNTYEWLFAEISDTTALYCFSQRTKLECQTNQRLHKSITSTSRCASRCEISAIAHCAGCQHWVSASKRQVRPEFKVRAYQRGEHSLGFWMVCWVGAIYRSGAVTCSDCHGPVIGDKYVSYFRVVFTKW